MITVRIESQIKPIVLLGAGASVDAGIPTAVNMTQKMIERFQSYDGPEATKTVKILKFVAKRLRGRRKIKKGASSQPVQGVDIEKLFATVKMLAERQTLEIAPFVACWSPRILLIKQFGNSRNIFMETNDNMLRILVKMVWPKDQPKVDYLEPLVRQGEKEVFTIATLNYDNSIDLAGKTAKVLVTDGLEDWSKYGEFRKPKEGIELLKLHGSIDWSITDSSIWKRNTMPHKTINRVPIKKYNSQSIGQLSSLALGISSLLKARSWISFMPLSNA